MSRVSEGESFWGPKGPKAKEEIKKCLNVRQKLGTSSMIGYTTVVPALGCCGGCQKITIVIFTHKQQYLSSDMKTKVVQYIPRLNINI